MRKGHVTGIKGDLEQEIRILGEKRAEYKESSMYGCESWTIQKWH